MNYLLDTHALLWGLFEPSKLSQPVADAMESPANDIYTSVVSFWEISLKYAIGKVDIHGAEPDDLPDHAKQMGVDILTVEPSEAASFHRLPRLGHKGPFDRLIIWQAIQRNLTILTVDREFRQYRDHGLRILW